MVGYLNYKLTPIKKPPIPVISVGNLTVGGSGKSPFVLEIAKLYKNPAIILRGYGRKSKGVQVVSKNGEILTPIESSGDEAMMNAKLLKKGFVIVAEDRMEGIKKASVLGANIALLDDGFRHKIEKTDILLWAKELPYFKRCLPSGAYRLPCFMKKYADFNLKEGIDYKRVVEIEDKTSKFLFVTAIANPSRIEEFLPKTVVAKEYFADHAEFDKAYLANLLQKSGAQKILTTSKDIVKMEGFGLPIEEMKLRLEIVGDFIALLSKKYKILSDVMHK